MYHSKEQAIWRWNHWADLQAAHANIKIAHTQTQSSGRVLTSADSIRDLEEKKRKKEKAIKKEENAKKREERSRKKKAEQIEREERAQKKAEQSKRKQSSKSPALGEVCLYHLGSQHNMYCQSIQLLLLTTRAENVPQPIF